MNLSETITSIINNVYRKTKIAHPLRLTITLLFNVYNVAINSSCRIQVFRFYPIPVPPLHQSPPPGFLPLVSRTNLLCNRSLTACLEAVLWYMQQHSRDRWPSLGLQPRYSMLTNLTGSNLQCIVSIQLLYVKVSLWMMHKLTKSFIFQTIIRQNFSDACKIYNSVKETVQNHD